MTKAQIMKRAHEIAKTLEGDYMARMSIALRQAWTEAKAATKATVKTQFSGFAKLAQPSRADGNDECCYLYFKGWQRYGKSRVYINDYKGRTLGYIENGAAAITNKQGLDTADINACVNAFMNSYNF
jgi:hypothetical protein